MQILKNIYFVIGILVIVSLFIATLIVSGMALFQSPLGVLLLIFILFCACSTAYATGRTLDWLDRKDP